MATELLTHAKTGVIQMGWPNLYEAVAFKGNKDDDKSAKKDDKKKNESTPAYGFPVLLDKDDPDHMRTVRILQKLSKNAEANAIALKKWGKKDRIVSNDGLKDADEDEILDGDKTVLMTDKYPNRANHFYVNFSRSSKAGRPGIRYIDDEGILRELPEPILGTKEDIQAAQANLNDARAAYATADEDAREEAKTLVLEATRNLEEAQERDAKAKEVKVLWDKLVYPGQNVQASVTARAWKTQTGSGVSYRLDNLTIVGGGVRDGSFEYDEDFTDEDIEALIAWRDKHVNAKLPRPMTRRPFLRILTSMRLIPMMRWTRIPVKSRSSHVARLPFPVVVRSLSRLKMMPWTRTRTRRKLRAIVRRRPLRGAVVSRLLSRLKMMTWTMRIIPTCSDV